jgi:hypothetical protein
MEVDEPDPPWSGSTVQCPVYYVREVLHDAKTRYLEVHKMLYAVLIASRNLRHYFQAHKISVVTSYPLRVVLHNPNTTALSLSGLQSWLSLSWTSLRAMQLRVRCSLILWQTGRCRQASPGSWTAVHQNHQLRRSSALTGPSTLMAPRASMGLVREPCSLLQLWNSSSTWCT